MINVLVLIAMLAMGSPNERVMGELTHYCPNPSQCTRGDSYGYIGYYSIDTEYAHNGECYTKANISLHDLSILPNDNVIVSCILATNGNVSYTVVYRLPDGMIGIDNWFNGIQSSRTIRELAAQ